MNVVKKTPRPTSKPGNQEEEMEASQMPPTTTTEPILKADMSPPRTPETNHQIQTEPDAVKTIRNSRSSRPTRTCRTLKRDARVTRRSQITNKNPMNVIAAPPPTTTEHTSVIRKKTSKTPKQFYIQEIIGRRTDPKTEEREYLVTWHNWPASYVTYQKRDSFADKSMVDEYDANFSRRERILKTNGRKSVPKDIHDIVDMRILDGGKHYLLEYETEDVDISSIKPDEWNKKKKVVKKDGHYYGIKSSEPIGNGKATITWEDSWEPESYVKGTPALRKFNELSDPTFGKVRKVEKQKKSSRKYNVYY
eukprot:526010_1